MFAKLPFRRENRRALARSIRRNPKSHLAKRKTSEVGALPFSSLRRVPTAAPRNRAVFSLVAARAASYSASASFFTASLGPKRLELLREILAKPATIALLVNPNNPASVADTANVLAAARDIGQTVKVLEAATSSDIETAFGALVRERPGALYMGPDQRHLVATLAARHALLTIYGDREIVEAGGLISYGASRSDAYHQAGLYVGRVLKGEKADDLPVVLPNKFELVINLQTARALGLDIPPKVLALADEVIE